MRAFRPMILGLSLMILAGATQSFSDERKPNRLSRESSPYLLLHAHNPVDWYPWGEEALAKAKKLDRPIFLSIGYSSCYWCHVMERKVFSDPEIARYMNENFINIKVDREERPDIDEIYMSALLAYYQAARINASGGWPLSMFLTPDARPIAGGTYFPPEDGERGIGFPSLMRQIIDSWENDQETLDRNAQILSRIVEVNSQPRWIPDASLLTESLVRKVADEIQETMDPKHGGFDFDERRPTRPKFPTPCKMELFLVSAHGNLSSASPSGKGPPEQILLMLDRIADGGIHDQLGGGFHRYSTDRTWTVPHFEKMLYDNAQLADTYLSAYQATGNRKYRVIAESIFEFVFAELSDPEGGFYSALDAETDGEEGSYYVWTEAELKKSLSQEEYAAFALAYGIDEVPNFEGKHVLVRTRTIPQIAEELGIEEDQVKKSLREARSKLLDLRDQRPELLRDTKILTAWNGMMIHALARGATLCENPDYRRAAEKAALFVLSKLRNEQGRLLRSHAGGKSKYLGYLDDYAFLVRGLLALHDGDPEDKRWLNAAVRLTDLQCELFWDSKHKGFFYTSEEHEKLLARNKPMADTVIPSSNSISARNLLAIAKLTGKKEYAKRAEELLAAFAPAMQESPRMFSLMALAVQDFTLSNTTLVKNTEPEEAPSETSEEEEKPDEEEKPIVTGKAYLDVDKIPAGGGAQILVRIKIESGWHINTDDAPEDLIPTELKIKNKLGIVLKKNEFPEGTTWEPLKEESHFVYIDEVDLIGTLSAPAKSAGSKETIEVVVSYQACNKDVCRRPTKLTLKLPVTVARKGEKSKPVNEKIFNPEPESP